MPSLISGSPSRRVLPVVVAMTDSRSARRAANSVATRASTSRRSCHDVLAQAACAVRARDTIASTSSMVVTSGGAAGAGRVRISCAHARLPGVVKSVSATLANKPSAVKVSVSMRRSWSRWLVVSIWSVRARDARNRSISRCHAGESGVRSNRARRKFSGPEFSSSRRDR